MLPRSRLILLPGSDDSEEALSPSEHGDTMPASPTQDHLEATALDRVFTLESTTQRFEGQPLWMGSSSRWHNLRREGKGVVALFEDYGDTYVTKPV